MYKLVDEHPQIRRTERIAEEKLRTALAACDGAVDRCAAQLRTPAEALRRYLGRWALAEDLRRRYLLRVPDHQQLRAVRPASVGAFQPLASVLAFRQQKFCGCWRRLILVVRVAYLIPWNS